MKRCINCGCELPSAANFCHICASSQIANKKCAFRNSEQRRHKLFALLISVGVAGIIALGIWGSIDFIAGRSTTIPPLQESPQLEPDKPVPSSVVPEQEVKIEPEPLIISSNTGELLYGVAGEQYRLSLSFFKSDGVNPPNDYDAFFEVEAGIETFTFSQLFVTDGTGSVANDNFVPLVKLMKIETLSENGNAVVRIDGPLINEDDPLALRSAMVFFSSACDTNTVRWTIYMKNGDVLSLQHVLTVKEPSIEPSEPNISSYPSEEAYFKRNLTNDQLEALKGADIHTLQSQISTVADAVAYLDQFPHGRNSFYDALNINLLMDIGVMLDIHRAEATGPDVYTCFTGWCLADDYAAAKYVVGSCDSGGYSWIHHALLLPTNEGYHVVSPAGHSKFWNSVRGFDEMTVTDFEDLKMQLSPLHAGKPDDSGMYIYHLYVVDVGCETMNFWLSENYLVTDSSATELYRITNE